MRGWRARARGALAVVAAALCVAAASASLMGVDLGVEYVKVSVARLGRGLELVTNEQAKRKTPAAVGFTEDGERLFGDAAVAYAARAPARTILAGRDLVGRCAAPPTPPSLRCPRETVKIDGAGEFAGEHVIAMLLGMARNQASAALDGVHVKDVVVTVPAWFDHHDRAAVADAARIVGLNCLAVVNANTAAAVKYALDGKGHVAGNGVAGNGKSAKEKGGKRIQTVMFYDLGAGSATASIARIASDKKTGVASSVKILGHAWERNVGGRAFDAILVDKMAAAFDAQRGSGAKPAKSIPRVVARLRKEAQRVREVLSANTETVVAVPSLYDDVDFRTSMTRAEFEAGAAHLFSRAVNPAKKVLADTGLSMSDVDAVVPFGGASRTPKVQELLCASLGIDYLNKSINSDEAAVMGSAFFAAMLSSTFRVRKMDIDDIYGRSVSAEIERDAKTGGLFSGSNSKPDLQKVVVFDSASSKMPSKKTLFFRRKDNFAINLYLDAEKSLWGTKHERLLYSRAKVAGVSKVLKKLKDPKHADGLTPKISLTVHLDRSGFIRIGAVESIVEEVIEVEREVRVKDDEPSKENATEKEESKSSGVESQESADSGGSDSSQGDNSDSKIRNETPKSSGSGEEAGSSSPDAKVKKERKKPKTRIEKSKQTLVHRHPLVVAYEDVPGSLYSAKMDARDVETSQKILKDLEAADIERVSRADAFNALEGFVLEVRSALRSVEEGDALAVVSSEEDRETLISKLDDAEDWMFTADAKVTSKLKDRLTSLKGDYARMKLRADEWEKRPAAVAKFKDFLNTTKDRISLLRGLHATSSTPHAALFDQVDKSITDAEAWLAVKEKEQLALKPTDDPLLLTTDLEDKMEIIAHKAVAVARLKLPEPSPDSAESRSRNQTGGSPHVENATDANVNDTTSNPPEVSTTVSDNAAGPAADVHKAKADIRGTGDSHDEL